MCSSLSHAWQRSNIHRDVTPRPEFWHPAVQVPDMHGAGNDMSPAVTPSAAVSAAASEVLIAPPTPERLMTAARPSAAHLLHDIPSMPIMSSLLTKPSGSQKVPHSHSLLLHEAVLVPHLSERHSTSVPTPESQQAAAAAPWQGKNLEPTWLHATW